MFTVLRKIRKSFIDSGSTRKYLIYAIGEIALVVIGILIALQINNWNEERKRQQNEAEVIGNLIQNLERDSMLFSNAIKRSNSIMVLHDDLFEIIVNKNWDVAIENPSYIRGGISYFPVTPDHNKEMTDQISNDSIRDDVLRYFFIEKRIKNAHEEFRKIIDDRMRVFLSKREIHDLTNWYRSKNSNDYSIIKRADLIVLCEDPEFQQLLLEASIKLNEFRGRLEDIVKYNDMLRDMLSHRYQ